jgi:hypothetical protein
VNRYFKLLVQEFFVSVDQGLIVGILAFVKTEKVFYFINLIKLN